MIPLRTRRLFRGFGPGRFRGIKGLIFAHCSSFSQNKFALMGWPPIRSANPLNLNMVKGTSNNDDFFVESIAGAAQR
jgi:hypothetical protein